MRRWTDPLALDPLSPIESHPTADTSATTDALELDPLSPLPAEEEIAVAGSYSRHTTERHDTNG